MLNSSKSTVSCGQKLMMTISTTSRKNLFEVSVNWYTTKWFGIVSVIFMSSGGWGPLFVTLTFVTFQYSCRMDIILFGCMVVNLISLADSCTSYGITQHVKCTTYSLGSPGLPQLPIFSWTSSQCLGGFLLLPT